jgi:uncharacterized protein YukE
MQCNKLINRFRDDMKQIKILYDKINDIISRIEKKNLETQKTLEDIDKRKNELIISL